MTESLAAHARRYPFASVADVASVALSNHSAAQSGRKITSLPGYGPPRTQQIAGYWQIDSTSQMYYWMIEAENPAVEGATPVLVWLQGGPGASSLSGLFKENGPYKINTSDPTRLVDNPFSWHKNAHLVYIDQPVVTGFSFTDRYRSSMAQVGDDLMTGIQQFYREHPTLRKNPLYISGESYAGKYIPQWAYNIIEHNEKEVLDPIPLAGIAIGDGWTDPLLITQTYALRAYEMGLVDGLQREVLEANTANCTALVGAAKSAEEWEHAGEICDNVEGLLCAMAGGVNQYDVRSYGQYNFSVPYLQSEGVMKALHAAHAFQSTASHVQAALFNDEMKPYTHLLPKILDNTRVLIYNGMYDMDCNLVATEQTYLKVPWKGQQAFATSKRKPMLVSGKVAFYIRSGETLTQAVGIGGGHIFPMDQPENALAMIDAFMKGKL